MRVIWFASPSDCEFDLTAAAARNPDVELLWYCFRDPLDVNHDFHLRQTTQANNIHVVQFETEEIENVFTQAAEAFGGDLLVVRHPTWLLPEIATRAAGILKDLPVICWTWEWLPNIAMHQMPALAPWPRIAVTNHEDLRRCREQFPEKQALYFPFGAVPWTDADLTPRPEYQADLVCDAQPHVLCACACRAKQQSVDIMVRPVADGRDLALWGNRYGQVWPCDWAAMPEFASHVRGTYETKDYRHVYASSKIYLGVTWNAPTGGYSIRLSRALSCGLATIWQVTAGMEEDIPFDADALAWAYDAESTKTWVDYYLPREQERRRLGSAGRSWVVEHWEWTKLLTRLGKEIR